MTTADFLRALRERDVHVWVEGGRLKVSAPAGALTADARAELATRKTSILELLGRAAELRDGPPSIVPLKPAGSRTPLFAIPGHGGDVFCYVPIVPFLHAEQPLLGVQPPGLDGTAPLRSIAALAAWELRQIRQHQPEGPYLLAGYCAGGTIAFEVACQLRDAGQEVAMLALFGSPFPTTFRRPGRARHRLRELFGSIGRYARALAAGSVLERVAFLKGRVRDIRASGRMAAQRRSAASPERRRIEAATLEGIRRYAPRAYKGEVDLFLPSKAFRGLDARPDLWSGVATVREHVGPDGCTYDVMLLEPWVRQTAGLLRARLDEIAGRTG